MDGQEASEHSQAIDQRHKDRENHRDKLPFQQAVADEKGSQAVDEHAGPDMIGRAGKEPDQASSAADDNNNDVEEDLPVKQGKEQAQDKERNRVADKVPEVSMKKIGEWNAEQASSGPGHDPIGIESDGKDQVQEIDCPDRTDQVDRNFCCIEFHGDSRRKVRKEI